MSTRAKADPLHEVLAICDPLAWADVRAPFDWDFNISVEASIKPPLRGEVTAAELRAALLVRAEALIAALAAAHWVLEEPPRFEFAGQLHRGMWTTAMKVFEAPAEYGIGLTLKLQVRRGEPL